MTEQYICGLEDSNNRISKELHDGVCNDLLAIELEMQQTGPSTLSFQLEQVREALRNLSHQLATPIFRNFSLYQVLTLYTDKLKTLESIHIECYIEENIKQLSFSPERTQEVYRILQEVISNLIKHADAKNAYITVTYEFQQINLLIEDDGKGFDSENPVNDSFPTGLGLKNIKERCSKLQGSYEIQSKKVTERLSISNFLYNFYQYFLNKSHHKTDQPREKITSQGTCIRSRIKESVLQLPYVVTRILCSS